MTTAKEEIAKRLHVLIDEMDLATGAEQVAASLRAMADLLDPTMFTAYRIGDCSLECYAGAQTDMEGKGPFPSIGVRALGGGHGGFILLFTHPDALDSFRLLLEHADKGAKEQTTSMQFH